ncbi:MAG: hypothetical protein ABIH87_00770 [bacterium]
MSEEKPWVSSTVYDDPNRGDVRNNGKVDETKGAVVGEIDAPLKSETTNGLPGPEQKIVIEQGSGNKEIESKPTAMENLVNVCQSIIEARQSMEQNYALLHTIKEARHKLNIAINENAGMDYLNWMADNAGTKVEQVIQKLLAENLSETRTMMYAKTKIDLRKDSEKAKSEDETVSPHIDNLKDYLKTSVHTPKETADLMADEKSKRNDHIRQRLIQDHYYNITDVDSFVAEFRLTAATDGIMSKSTGEKYDAQRTEKVLYAVKFHIKQILKTENLEHLNGTYADLKKNRDVYYMATCCPKDAGLRDKYVDLLLNTIEQKRLQLGGEPII